VDCEKFDRVALDLLYDELDELTSAAAKRHVEHCARCRGINGELRATRSVGALKLVDPPEGLELKILEAERRAHAGLPVRQRVGRAISIMAAYAMRPQLAMAALLVLMIGSSLFFLRARPGGRGNVLVTERGVPEGEADSVAIVPSPERRPVSAALRAAPAHGPLPPETDREPRRERSSSTASDAPSRAEGRAAAPAGRDESTSKKGDAAGFADDLGSHESAYEAALGAYKDGRYVEAQRRFEEIAVRGGDKAAVASLYAAQALRSKSGCPAAAPVFAEVHARYRGSSVGSEAAWQAGDCYRSLGELERARENYEALLGDSAYGDRAQAALSDIQEREQRQAAARASAAAPAKAKAGGAAQRPAAEQAAPPQKPAANTSGF
jgi:hypothetical protein